MAFGAGICAGGRYPANEPKWRRAQGAHTNDRTRPFPPSRRRRQALDFDREIDGGQPDVGANSRPALCVALSRIAREVCEFRCSPVRNAKRGKGEASAARMCEFGRARLGARWGYFVFIIRALSPTGALSHAIFVSDFQDLCYRCSWFPKRPRARPEARRAWIVGRLLRSRCGSVLVARRCGGASSPVYARGGPAAEGHSERTAARSLDSPASP